MLEGVATSGDAARTSACATRTLKIRDLGRMRYLAALEIQNELVERRKLGLIPDQLLFLEHPHVVTMGRNGHDENLLAGPELLFARKYAGGDSNVTEGQ